MSDEQEILRAARAKNVLSKEEKEKQTSRQKQRKPEDNGATPLKY